LHDTDDRRATERRITTGDPRRTLLVRQRRRGFATRHRSPSHDLQSTTIAQGSSRSCGAATRTRTSSVHVRRKRRGSARRPRRGGRRLIAATASARTASPSRPACWAIDTTRLFMGERPSRDQRRGAAVGERPRGLRRLGVHAPQRLPLPRERGLAGRVPRAAAARVGVGGKSGARAARGTGGVRRTNAGVSGAGHVTRWSLASLGERPIGRDGRDGLRTAKRCDSRSRALRSRAPAPRSK
jgi:hypothetical protein